VKRLGDVVRIAQGLAVVRLPGAESSEGAASEGGAGEGAGSAGEGTAREGPTTADLPDLGTPVVAESLEEVGEVVDVFGPTDRPYCSVAPEDDVRPATLVGSPLYVRE
jgi:rRNA processing protein Gar1